MKVLFIAYAFPPAKFIGSVRAWNIAKHLSRLGWRVTVVTPGPDSVSNADRSISGYQNAEDIGIRLCYTHHQSRFYDVRSFQMKQSYIARLFGRLLSNALDGLDLERAIGWIPDVKHACRNLLPGSQDIVLATGNPWVSFSLARWAANRIGCPYVLDYRDLWTSGNPHHSKSHLPWSIYSEKRSISNAGAITVVSPSMKESLSRAFHCSDKLHVITNGYDRETLDPITPTVFPEPAIVYAGNLYPPLRVLDPVFAALRPLDSPGFNWKFHYFGGAIDLVSATAGKYELAHRVECHGVVSSSEARSAAKGARVSVVVTSTATIPSLNDLGIVTGKIFELIGMGCEILLIAPPGSDAECIMDTCGCRLSSDQTERITEYFSSRLLQSRQLHAPVPEHDWSQLAVRFDEILRDSVVAYRSHCS